MWVERPVARSPFADLDGSQQLDSVAVEEPLQIRIQAKNPGREGGDISDIAITMRTPGNDQELAAGFLFSEGILTSVDQIESMKTDDRGAICIANTAESGAQLPDVPSQ